MPRVALLIALLVLPSPGIAYAGMAFGVSDTNGALPGGLAGGHRWDAAPRTIAVGERSLNGGLRFALQGVTFQAFRDSFTWQGAAPSVVDFEQAVRQSFAAWESVDPATGLTTSLSFVYDPSTMVIGSGGFGGIDTAGAEIDLLAVDRGTNSTSGAVQFLAGGGGQTTLTLTSGTTAYTAFAINGADISMNSNSGAAYTLDLFRRILTHEIGHTIGLGDLESAGAFFLDDNYLPGDPAGTLTNSWAGLVNSLNPSASNDLEFYTLSGGALTTGGVDLLMESFGTGIGATNPIGNLVPLTNDEYGMRQFLYPSPVPEPSTLLLLAGGLICVGWQCKRRFAKPRRT